MATYFIIVIYITFIGLGLPDSMLGAGWPAMYGDLGAPIESNALLGIILNAGLVLSSFCAERFIARFGTGKVTACSVLITALALLGIVFAPSFLWLAVLCLPLGMGGGAVDVAINNYVALHYKPHHMNWLHSFWGLGALCGPLVMSFFLRDGDFWRQGFLTISLLQFAIVLLLFLTLPRWKTAPGTGGGKETRVVGSPFRLPNIFAALAAFILYCGVEYTMNSWGSTYLVEAKGFTASAAAGLASVFFIGITAGRFLSGFFTLKFSSQQLIRMGGLMMLAGLLLLALPLPGPLVFPAFILVGLGCAPVFPGMLHETPRRFGREWSQKVMGFQMAFAYSGSTLLAPLFGLISARLGFQVLPLLLLAGTVGMIACCEYINARLKSA